MRKYITVIIWVLCSPVVRGEALSDFLFRIDWGSRELGGIIEQDAIVFSIDDFRIIRPTQKDKDKLIYTWLPNRERLRWAVIGNISGNIQISSYGKLPEANGMILDIREMLSKKAFLKIKNLPKDKMRNDRKLELYRIDGEYLDPIFYISSSSVTGNCLINTEIDEGHYILAVKSFQDAEPFALRVFWLGRLRIDLANEEFTPIKGSPQRFSGVVELDFDKMALADPKWEKALANRIPKTSALAGALTFYYSSFSPIPEYSFKYDETLEYQMPFEDENEELKED